MAAKTADRTRLNEKYYDQWDAQIKDSKKSAISPTFTLFLMVLSGIISYLVFVKLAENTFQLAMCITFNVVMTAIYSYLYSKAVYNTN